MSSMFEIYSNYANLYEELINHEDYNNNLEKLLAHTINWNNKSICEFGVGTGRVTKIYIQNVSKAVLCDNSPHMISKAKENLLKWDSKLEYLELDNKNLKKLEDSYDIVIEGWSFGHLIVNENNDRSYWMKYLVDKCKRLARDKIVFIETMGTNVDSPKAPGDTLGNFYSFLKENDFIETIIETDYKFRSYTEAGRIMGNFFGESMKENIFNTKKEIIKEFTGIWVYNKN